MSDFTLDANATATELLQACQDAAHDIAYVLSQPWSKRSEGDTVVLKTRLKRLEAIIANAIGKESPE